MTEMMAKWQTSCTPNVLGIYLLMRSLEKRKGIDEVHFEIVKRYEKWVDFFSSTQQLKHLVVNQDVQSYTVIPVASTPELIQDLKRKAKKKGILLGEGYGAWKPSSFRIANFPALQLSEIRTLLTFLKHF